MVHVLSHKPAKGSSDTSFDRQPIYDAFVSYSQRADKAIAQALRSVIQSIGKPWWRIRSLNVFLDAASLSAAPDLWQSIEAKLDRSRFLILLASPEAAASHWVDKEVSHFIGADGAGVGRVLIGLTGGNLAWSRAAGDFDDEQAVPLPPCLKGRFRDEPLWVDLRPFHGTAAAVRSNQAFLHAALDFAATIKGVEKADLYSDEVKRQRRSVRMAYGIVTVVTGLAIGAGAAAWVAVDNASRAAAEAERADQEAKAATKSSNFALATTDRLAVEIVLQLQSTGSVPTKDKLYLIDHIDRSLNALLQQIDDSPVLKRRYANLLTSMAFVLYRDGYNSLGREKAEHAALLLPAAGSLAGDLIDQANARTALALGQAARMDYVQAEHLLQEASSALQGLKDGGLAAEIAEARILSSRAAIWWNQRKLDALASSLAETIPRLRAELERAPARSDARAARALYVELLNLERIALNVAQTFGDPDQGNELRAFRRDADLAKPFFSDGNDPQWQVYLAQADVFEAGRLFADAQKTDALEQVGVAVDSLKSLLARDAENLALRRELVAALLVRQGFLADQREGDQARFDITVARTLVVSMKRDDEYGATTLALDTTLDWALGTVLLREGRYSDALYEYLDALARTNRSAGTGEDAATTGRIRYVSYDGLARAGLGGGNLKDGRENAERALAALTELEAAAGRSVLTLAQRVNAETNLLQILDAAKERDAWEDAWRQTTKDLDELIARLPAPATWLAIRGDLQFKRGGKLRDAGDHYNAAVAYGEALDSELKLARLQPTNFSSRARAVLYASQRIIELNDWPQILETIRPVGAALDTFQDSAQDKTGLIAKWAALAAHLETAASKAGGGDATAMKPSELAEEASRVGEAATLAATQSQISAAQASGGDIRVDLKSLELPGLAESAAGDIAPSVRLGWLSQPPFPGPWRSLVGAEFDAALVRFSALPDFAERIGSTDRILRVRTISLPFYRDGALLEAEFLDNAGVLSMMSVLSAGGQDRALNGTSPPIHDANATALVGLKSASDAATYLRFFCAFVAYEGAPFEIVDSSRDISWQPTADDATKIAIGKTLRPVALWPDPEIEGWRATAAIRQRDAILYAVFKIHTDGVVEMLDSKPIAEGLPLSGRQAIAGSIWAAELGRGVDVRAFGESMVNSEAATLHGLALLPAGRRPAFYLAMASEAAALQLTSRAADQLAPYANDAVALHFEAGKYAEALSFQHSIVDRWSALLGTVEPGNPRLPASLREYANERTRLAHLALLNGDPITAETLAGAVLKTAPDDGWAAMQLAHARVAKGDMVLAQALYSAHREDRVGDMPWLQLAAVELRRIEASNHFGREIAAFRKALPAQLQVSGATPPMKEMPKPVKRLEDEYPSFSEELTKEFLVKHLHMKTDGAFSECGFLMGKDDTVIVVVPYALPDDDNLRLYVDWYTVTFMDGDRVLADLQYEGGKVHRRLSTASQVGLVAFPPDIKVMPDHITHVAEVVNGRPQMLPH
jgi:hypothetical protein